MIVIEGDSIREIGTKGKMRYSRAAKIIPGKGLYGTPGLFDLHAHITFLRDPNRFAGYDRDTSERILKFEPLAEAGIPPLEITKIATRNSAEGLGILNVVGTLEGGNKADLVILSADPVADISNFRKVEK